MTVPVQHSAKAIVYNQPELKAKWREAPCQVTLFPFSLPGRLGGVGRILVEAFLQGSDPQLQGAHQGEHSRLRGWRNRVPEILWQWWSIRHATVLLNSHSEDKIGS